MTQVKSVIGPQANDLYWIGKLQAAQHIDTQTRLNSRILHCRCGEPKNEPFTARVTATAQLCEFRRSQRRRAARKLIIHRIEGCKPELGSLPHATTLFRVHRDYWPWWPCWRSSRQAQHLAIALNAAAFTVSVSDAKVVERKSSRAQTTSRDQAVRRTMTSEACQGWLFSQPE